MVPARDVTAGERLPAWARATVDGYAVRAADTSAAAETLPAFLQVTGAVAMGRLPEGAEAKAQEIGQPMDIAVVDDGGNLRSHVRMDGAFIGSITISINKAYTAIAFQTQTRTSST